MYLNNVLYFEVLNQNVTSVLFDEIGFLKRWKFYSFFGLEKKKKKIVQKFWKKERKELTFLEKNAHFKI